jgi:hypothetical protein
VGGIVNTGQTNIGRKELTEPPIILESRMKAHDARMASTESGEGFTFGNGSMHLIVPDEMGFFEDLNSILLSCEDVGRSLYLL